ncbi:M56 family metallopeptidase [Altibacter sp.]|uniref:M56 family metallopeptidase n=1 Tax=Altibacter sp. TaxID=2024823 RepID=UPI0025874479|nr:M56 family metallopeptidase [Altibacter sp.]MCW9036725.1 hypothetical protein [Altibacter sp.]
MELYLIKSTVCLAILYVFYKIFLEDTSFHVLKRWFLLTAVGIAFLIPGITFTTYVEAPAILTQGSNTGIIETPLVVDTTPSINMVFLLKILYLGGLLFFGFRFAKNMWALLLKIKRYPKQRYKHFIHVLLPTTVTPHTFFNYIFLNRTRFEAQEIPSEVLLHEQTHALQKHSADILIIELLQIIFWFNPLFYLIKRSIKLNHEFLADRAVLQQGIETSHYQHTLLAFSSNAAENSLANSIHYSSIKKRFTVMKTHTSKKAILLKSLVLVPLLTCLVLGFSSQEVIAQKATDTAVTSKQQEKASAKEISEYNALAKKYNSMSKASMNVKKSEVDRLKYLYGKMTVKQREKAVSFPDLPPPPPAPDAPAIKTGVNDMGPNVPPPPPPAPDAPQIKKGEKSMIPPPPPPAADTPQPAPDPAEYVIKMAKKGADFFVGPHKITPDEAIDLVRKSNIYKIKVDDTNPLRPVVHFEGC